MASITTHKYTPKTNNKENESCNGKRDEAKTAGRACPISDYEKQKSIDQQRKLRLNQVRQQSKEIASQIRENVRCEEKRQLDKVNEVKRNEMMNWRRKQIGQKDKDYKMCLKQVGEAHLAAEHENIGPRKIEEQKEKNRKLALKRGKLAAQKMRGELKLNKCKTTNTPEKRVKNRPMATGAKNDSDVSISSETSSDSSVIFVESKKDVIPKRSPVNVKWSHEINDYDPTKFTSINSSTITDISLTDSPICDSPPVISRVSKLLQKSNSSDQRISKTYKLTKSPDKRSQHRFSTTPHKGQNVKKKITTISSRLKKNQDESPTEIGLEKKHFVPEFVRKKSVTSTNRVGQLNQVSNALRQKVNFYDHSNRFSKQYESAISVEQNVHEIVPPNAWEEAERDIQLQRIMNKSKSDMRQFEENRAEIALEKDCIRKDYDLMSKDLRNILKDENFSKNISQGYESMLESHSLSNSTNVQDVCDSSMLLDFVTIRTSKICDDIDRCRKENGKNKSQTKIEALHGLLKKVNTLRKILFEEIKQNHNNVIDTKKIINEISKLEEEQNKIMLEKSPNMENTKDSFKDRERTLCEREEILRMKESCIDEKARELYLREKEIHQKKKVAQNLNDISKNVNEAIKIVKNNVATGIDEIPVKIVINVNKGDKPNEKSADDVKWCERLRKSVLMTESRQTEPIRSESGKIYPKTPAIKTKSIPNEQKQFENSSQSTSVTAYMNPPELIETQLSKALGNSGLLSKLKTQIGSNMNDNEMLHYIIRLLGMSRTSIEQLNLSSVSTVKTPDSSIINISSNQKFISSSTSTPLSISSSCLVEQTESIEKNKLQQLVRFLSENVNLTENGERQSHNSIENTIWNNILSQKKEEKSVKAQKNDKNSTEMGVINGSREPEKQDLMTKYDELAANCTERIRNLDSMISKVREEKQKILENTLSSAESLMSQSQKENVTEYMEIPKLMDIRIKQKSEQNGNLISSPSSENSTNAASSDFSPTTSGTAADLSSNGNRINLTTTRNKEFGESKDSGVGVSRPVTSSDFRDSPDLKQNNKICDLDSNKHLLSLALREEKHIDPESYKVMASHNMNSDNLAKNTRPDCSKTTNNREKHPPIALNRYNPQIEDELPHELSTITEVDTPATSRINATDVNCNDDRLLKRNNSVMNIPDNEVLKFLYNQFPNFKDYIMCNGSFSNNSINDSVEVTAATSAILGDKLENLFGLEVPVEILKYQKFCSKTENNETMKPKEPEIGYAKFPSHFQYAQTASGLLDSQSIDRADLSDDTSLPDVLSELKARNIIDHSFEGVSSGEGSFKDLLAVPTNLKMADSPSDNLSENLEQDLNSIGLKWATTILRKSKEISTSSSSISSNHEDMSQRSLQRHSPKKISNILKTSANKGFNNEKIGNITNNTSVRTDETQMKSMNLKEFLARELLKHSSMSSSSADSSLASIFLKSFLEPYKDLTKISENSPNCATDKHRTSTPVQNNGESIGDSKINLSIKSSTVRRNLSENETSLPNTAANDLSKFFSGGSHLSSVRSTSTDSTTASSDEKHQ